jgi:hypothetical protein
MASRLPGILAGVALGGVVALALGVARAARPTDIVRVDDYIGAPRVLFGRTGADVERTLGRPLKTARASVSSYRDPVVFWPTQRLSYPGLVIDVLATGRLRRVQLSLPGRGLPFGLDVGSLGTEVEQVLGEPQEAVDDHLMYLYSDGYPDTVHFHLRDGRVRGIEWNFGSAE